MPFLGKLDIYGMKNRLIRYPWMLKFNDNNIMPLPIFKPHKYMRRKPILFNKSNQAA